MYVGYFGAAAGVFLLVVLGMMIDESLVKVNAVKNALSGMANATAAVCFALFGDVRWTFVAPLAAGFLIGGWIGPKIARKVPAGMFRVFVSLCGIPAVTLEGTVEDWEKVRERVGRLGRYDLCWWTDMVGPLIDEFVKAAKGNPTPSFWKNLYKEDDGSGSSS